MIFAEKGPPPGHGGDPLELSSLGGIDLRANSPNQGHAQHLKCARLRLVQPAPPPRPRRIDIRISAFHGRSPIGRSRAFYLSDRGLDALIMHAARLEAGS